MTPATTEMARSLTPIGARRSLVRAGFSQRLTPPVPGNMDVAPQKSWSRTHSSFAEPFVAVGAARRPQAVIAWSKSRSCGIQGSCSPEDVHDRRTRPSDLAQEHEARHARGRLRVLRGGGRDADSGRDQA